MGYNTDFIGNFELSKVPGVKVIRLMEDLTETRHDDRVMPSLWCQWVLRVRGDVYYITYSGDEKFYEYIAWIKYIIDNIMVPDGIKLNGEMIWQGEDITDRGCIEICDNVVNTYQLR